MRSFVIALIILIVGAHILMWTSDMPRSLAFKLTALNAAGWAVVLLPAWAVSKWAKVHAQTPKNDEEA